MRSSRDLPRVVIVHRKTPLEHLLERWGTAGQVKFYLESQGQNMELFAEEHEAVQAALAAVESALPADQRRVRLERSGIDRFVFRSDDLVIVVGQDGLVPNTAKYLDGQTVVGVNPDPGRIDGILCPHSPADTADLLDWSLSAAGRTGGRYRVARRRMASARREDGQSLLALNEIFIGHRTHQSARYRLTVDGRSELQSSSGIICATGTGSTGWAASIARQRGVGPLPGPEDSALAWFVREPFPSCGTGTELDFGFVGAGDAVEVSSRMGEGGVIFADGIESDWLEFLDGQSVRVEVASRMLELVVTAT